MEVCCVTFHALNCLPFFNLPFRWEHISFSARSKGLSAPRGGSHFEKLIGFPSHSKAAGRMYPRYAFLKIYNQRHKKPQKRCKGNKGNVFNNLCSPFWETRRGVIRGNEFQIKTICATAGYLRAGQHRFHI